MVERLKKARKAAKLSPRALSLAAGLSSPAAGNIERGGDLPAIDTVEQLARALAVAPCWLAYGQLGERTFGSGRFPSAVQGDDAPRPAAPAPELSCAKAGARVSKARDAAGLSLRALARAADLAPTTISNIEEGRSFPSVETAEKLAGALGVSPCWLAYGVGAGPNN